MIAALTLGSLALCLEDDCRVAFDSVGQKTCPACGSRSWHLVSRWLDRRVTEHAR